MPNMKSRNIMNILIFIGITLIYGASLSCPNNIIHNSSKDSHDQSGLRRPGKKIPNDNNLAREIPRNNNLARGKSIVRNKHRLNTDNYKKIVEKHDNSKIPYRYFATHSANYFTNRDRKVKPGFSKELQNFSYSKTNKEEGLSSSTDIKLEQIGSKFSREIDDFSSDTKHNSHIGNFTSWHAKSGLIKSNSLQRTKRKEFKKRRENHRASNKQQQQQRVRKPHSLYRREVSVINSTQHTNNASEQTGAKDVHNIQSDTPISKVMQEVKIATVLPENERHPFCIKRVRPAIELAIDKMNQYIAHHNRYLTVRFRDSKCDIADGINECINFYVRKEMHVLFGPCCDYTVAPCARQVVYWNIPMITAGGLAGDFGLGKDAMYSTMTRVGSNFNTLVQFFVDVLGYYKWKKLKLVYDPFGQTNISTKFCHIAANDIHYGLREIHQSKNITQTYVKFELPEIVPSDFQQQIGLDCADHKDNKTISDYLNHKIISDYLNHKIISDYLNHKIIIDYHNNNIIIDFYKHKIILDNHNHKIISDYHNHKIISDYHNHKIISDYHNHKIISDYHNHKIISDYHNHKIISDYHSHKIISDYHSHKIISDYHSHKIIRDYLNHKIISDYHSHKIMSDYQNHKIIRDFHNHKIISDDHNHKIISDYHNHKIISDYHNHKIISDYHNHKLISDYHNHKIISDYHNHKIISDHHNHKIIIGIPQLSVYFIATSIY